MKKYRIYTAVITILIFACIFTSCMQKRRDSGKTDPSETQVSKEIPDFDHERFYVLIGTMGENNEYARLRYFDGDDVDMVVWKCSPSEYEYGDVFIPEENVSPVNVVVNETDPAYPRSWFELQGDAGLELIGNCRDLFESKKLTVTRNEYDGMRHFSIFFKDKMKNEYSYRFFDLGPFGVEVSSAGEGDVYDCAVRNGKIIIPLSGPVT